jgi:hypothetical protein
MNKVNDRDREGRGRSRDSVMDQVERVLLLASSDQLTTNFARLPNQVLLCVPSCPSLLISPTPFPLSSPPHQPRGCPKPQSLKEPRPALEDLCMCCFLYFNG